MSDTKRDLGRLWEPGSLGAKDNGCRCPVIDNSHGLGHGVDENGEPVFVMVGDCPLHGWEAARDDS